MKAAQGPNIPRRRLEPCSYFPSAGPAPALGPGAHGFTVVLIGTNLPELLGRSQQEILKGLAGDSGDKEQAKQNQKYIK